MRDKKRPRTLVLFSTSPHTITLAKAIPVSSNTVYMAHSMESSTYSITWMQQHVRTSVRTIALPVAYMFSKPFDLFISIPAHTSEQTAKAKVVVAKQDFNVHIPSTHVALEAMLPIISASTLPPTVLTSCTACSAKLPAEEREGVLKKTIALWCLKS